MLNISTDSSGKLGDLLPPTPTVFPQTAPNRDNKDKKLFTATRKLAQGTPKGGGLPKRLVEEVTNSLSNHQNLLAQTKKAQKPGIEILSAFRSSAAAQSNARKVLTPSAQRSTLVSENIFKSKPKVEPQPGMTNGPGLSPKNRSFRGVKASEYLKNNFFIKNAFFNGNEGETRGAQNKTRPEGASVNTSSGKVGAKLGGDKPQSARTDATQFNHALRALIERNSGLGQSHKDKPASKKADAWDNDTSDGGLDLQQAELLELGDLFFVEARLQAISKILEKDLEIYDQVKEYVDIVQEVSFHDLYTAILNPKIQAIVKNSMILERWAMFFVFFFYFNHDVALQIFSYLRQLIKLVHSNNLSYMRQLCAWLSVHETTQVTSCLTQAKFRALHGHLTKRIQEYPQLLDENGEDLRRIKKNNMSILSLFKSSIQYLEPKIQAGMHQMFEGLDQMTLKDGLENCLDAFCDFVANLS